MNCHVSLPMNSRVIQFIDRLDPRLGGPVSYVIAASETLTAMGHQNWIMTREYTLSPSGAERPLSLPGWAHPLHFSQVVRNALKTSDVVHIHGLFAFDPWWLSLWCRLCGHPYILSTHGQLDEFGLQQGRFKKASFMTVVGRSMLRHAKAVVALSERERTNLCRWAAREKIRLIPPPLPMEALTNTLPVRVRQPKLRILFLGRLHPVKGLPLLMEAVSMLAAGAVDCELHLVGDGEAAYVAALRRTAFQLGIEDKVIFHGFLSGDEKFQTALQADVGILPSLQESFGIACLEMMALGLPVVVSDRVALAPDITATGAGSVFPAGDARAAADRLAAFQDEQFRQQKARRAAEWVKREFSKARFENNLRLLYT